MLIFLSPPLFYLFLFLGNHILTQIYICSYSCYKRLYESNRIPKDLDLHIVNKEDYKGLIRPVPRIKQKEFEYLTLDEVNKMTDIDKEKYFLEKDKIIHINPYLSIIQDEIYNEDKRIYMIEEDDLYDDGDSELFDDY